MLACRAYYTEGRFVPLDPLDIPEGSQAIVAVLDLPQDDICSRQRIAMALFREAIRTSEPLPLEFDEILSHRVRIDREVDL